jgi:hypothetical protein
VPRSTPRPGKREEHQIMDAQTLLIIIIVLIVLAGGGWYGRGRWF